MDWQNSGKMKKCYFCIILLVLIMSVSILGCNDKYSQSKKHSAMENAVTMEKQTLENTYCLLTQQKKLNVAYFGDSVTEGYSPEADQVGPNGFDIENPWRKLTSEWLREQYPDAEITDSGRWIGGTTTLTGAFLSKSVIKQTKPDLVFISYAINDLAQKYSTSQLRRYMESIINNVYCVNKKADIVIVYYAGAAYEGESIKTVEQFNTVADYYGIGTLDLTPLVKEFFVKNNISYNDNTCKEYLGVDGLHPTIKGHSLYAEFITDYLNEKLSKCSATKQIDHTIPKPMEKVYKNPSYMDYKQILSLYTSGYVWTKDNQYACVTDTVTFDFTGTDFGLGYALTDLNADYTATVDGITVDIPKISKVNNYQMLFSNLENKKHKVTITTSVSNGISIKYALINSQ